MVESENQHTSGMRDGSLSCIVGSGKGSLCKYKVERKEHGKLR